MNPEPEQSQHVSYVLANAFTQLLGGRHMPPEAKFLDPCITLPLGMRDAVMLFQQELAKCNCCSMTPSLPRFVGMMEWDPESVTDSESRSEGSCHLVWECNMLHLLENGVAVVGGKEDDTYLIPRTLGEQVECEQEHLE
jgi:hypothetical protein